MTDTKKPKKKASIWQTLLGLLIILMVIGYFIPSDGKDAESGQATSQPREPLDFTKDVESINVALKTINKKITAAQFLVDENGKKMVGITYLARSGPNPLLAESKDIMAIGKAIAQAPGAEGLSSLGIILQQTLVDQYNNKQDVGTLTLLWQGETLQKINWQGFQDWKFMNLIGMVKANVPVGAETVAEYCKDNPDYAQQFCQRARLTVK